MVCRGVVPIGPGCGGAEAVAYELARALAAAGHHVTLLSDALEPEHITAHGVALVPLGRPLSPPACGFFSWVLRHLTGNLAAARAARAELASGQYDVVHVHGALTAMRVAAASRVPVVYTEHDAPPWHCRYRYFAERVVRRSIYRALNVRAWRSVDAVGATFDGLRDEMISRWGLGPAEVQWIPNATDIERFQPRARDDARVGFDRFCLFVGRLTPRKAPDLLIQALADTRDVACVFAGDGPMRARLQELAESVGVSDRVAFLGNVDTVRLAELYAHADLLVLPSVSEAAPLAAVEAMASGTPVLATRIAGVPALVEDHVTGFLVNPGDVGGLSVALRLLTRDRELLREMGIRAQQRAAADFTWTAVTKKYVDLYRGVSPSQSARAGRFRRRPRPAQPRAAGAELILETTP